MRRRLALLAILLSAGLVGTVHAQSGKVIRFGVDASYPPFESVAPNGQLVGFDIDIGKAICAQLHAKCVWVRNDFDGIIPALKARKFDGILSSMTRTPAREKQIAFSSKIYQDPSRMVARKGSGLLPTAESLKGKSVGVESGTIQEAYAKTYWQPKGVNVVPYQNQDQVYSDLISGRLDAAFQDAVQAQVGFLATPKGKGFAFAGGVVSNDPKDILGNGTAIGLRKGDTKLRQEIDQAIAAIIKDGTYKKIASKYFDFNIYGS